MSASILSNIPLPDLSTELREEVSGIVREREADLHSPYRHLVIYLQIFPEAEKVKVVHSYGTYVGDTDQLPYNQVVELMKKTNLDKAKPGDIAFWGYDLYPFMLCGTITRIKNDDSYPSPAVETKEYGPGHWLKPRFVLPPAEGEVLRRELKLMEKLHRAAQDAAHQEFKRVADERIAQLRDGHAIYIRPPSPND